MKKPKIDSADVARWMKDLSDQQLISFFYEHLSARHVYRAEHRHLDSHLVLANAKRTREEGGLHGPWRVEVLCPTPAENWSADAPVCQFGEHCGVHTASVSRRAQCPVCGGEAIGG